MNNRVPLATVSVEPALIVSVTLPAIVSELITVLPTLLGPTRSLLLSLRLSVPLPVRVATEVL